MNTPQVLLLVLYGGSLLISAHDHGKEKTGKNNFWVTFISMCIVLAILHWGGFFK